MAAVAAMASASSLASQQFSGLHCSFSISPPPSPNALFSKSAQSQTCLSSSRRAPRGVFTMTGAGKFFVGGIWQGTNMKKSSSTLISDLNDAKLGNDVEIYGGVSGSLKLNEQASCFSASSSSEKILSAYEVVDSKLLIYSEQGVFRVKFVDAR